MRFYNIGDQYNDQIAIIRNNGRWFKLLRWTRGDPPLREVVARCRAGTCDAKYRACWTSEAVAVAAGRSEAPPTSATFQRSHDSDAANAAVSALCKVSFDVLHAIDGVHDWHFVGAGVVIDADAGLVAVDRNTIVTSLGECSVTFAASVELPARVLFVHPTHNFALIKYDARHFAAAGAKNRPTAARLEPRPLRVGDNLQFVGLCRTNPDQSLSQRVSVTEISCVNIAQAHVPRFRALNEEIAKFDQVLNKSLGGVLVEPDTGSVVATWSCYSFYSWNDEKNYEAFHAVGVDVLADAARKFRHPVNGAPPVMHSVGFGLKRLPLSTARTSMRLDEAWVTKLQAAQPERSQVLSVAQLAHDGASDGDVVEGDLLLAVDGRATATFRDVSGKRPFNVTST